MLKSSRIESIDLLRGIVMVIMTLDHVRDYFHADAFMFDPADLTQTNIAIFLTRWITHYCAPVFVFLAGTSAYLIGIRKGTKALSVFLLKRGIWLVVAEVVIVGFGWFFNFHFSLIALGVIWAIGMSMIGLAAAVYLPYKAILILGLLIVFGHNGLDNIHFHEPVGLSFLWSVIHDPSFFQFIPGHAIFLLYPILSWMGVMFLGYSLGLLFQPDFDSDKRKKILLYLGVATSMLFIVVRYVNIYGDPRPWFFQTDSAFTVLSFLNATKYPPSLLYLLMTLGPALIFLSISENFKGRLAGGFIVLGRVPFFYYLAHIYLIHVLAIIAVISTGFNASVMILDQWVTTLPALKGYGFSLGVVYLIWAGTVIVLYPICKWYDNYKTNNRNKWWLSYV